jgi:hypothetical protein
MGLVVKTTRHPEQDEPGMPYEWFVGIDWGSQRHQVCVLDRDCRRVGERATDHDGASLAQLPGFSANNARVHVPQKARQSLAGVGLQGDAKDRSGR